MAHSPKLDLPYHSFEQIVSDDCEGCDRRTRQERYEGHGLALGSAIQHCLTCGGRKMMAHE